jgi:hypothetical protein
MVVGVLENCRSFDSSVFIAMRYVDLALEATALTEDIFQL